MTGKLGDIILITGGRGTGKSTLCKHVIESAKSKGWQAGGLLSLARLECGEKVGIDVINVATGVSYPLAWKNQGQAAELSTHAWVFDPERMAWGNQVFQEVLPCDLLIVDELGPLEFMRNQGWLNALPVIESKKYKLALVVIRPELIDVACERWQTAEVYQINGVEEVSALGERIALTRLGNENPASE